MAVNNEFCFTLRGKPTEVFSCMELLIDKMSTGGLTVNGQWYSTYNDGLNKIRNLINFDASEIYHAVSSGGPYGRFELLAYCEEVIRDILTKNPNIILNGEVHSDSCVDGSQRILSFEYHDNHLIILDSEYFNPIDDESYWEYVKEILPYKQFIKLFSIDRDEFEEEEYEDFIMDYIQYGDMDEWSYDDFCDDFDTELTERQFNNRMKKFKELNILTYDDWQLENDVETVPDKKYWNKWEIDI